MPELRLAKLPDRNPVKITITVRPELHAALRAYAELYREHYGEEESIAELIPYMLDGFLEGDRSFAKARKDMEGDNSLPPVRRTRRGNGGDATTSKP